MSHASVIVALSPEQVNSAGSVEKAVEHQMKPFDESGEWFKEGSRWDWWVVGGRYSGRLLGKDVVKRSQLTEKKMTTAAKRRAEEAFDEFKSRDMPPEIGALVYGISATETRKNYVAKRTAVLLSAFAFLKDRQWHEAGRMGWFGSRTATECERAGVGPNEHGRCIHEHKDSGAKIFSWGDEDEKWAARYWHRFVRNLPPDTVLVMVDYHV